MSFLHEHSSPANFYQLGIAWLAGARFDIAWSQARQDISKVLNMGASQAPAQVTQVLETVVEKSEL